MNYSLAKLCVEKGILVFSPPERLFPQRQNGSPSEVIMDVRGAACNLTLRSLLLGGLLHALSQFHAEAIIGGVSRGGIVLGAQLALVAGRPFAVVLPEGPRVSGLQRSVEGSVHSSAVVLFDNVTNTGTSLCAAAQQVTNAGGTVAGALVICTYGATPSLPFPLHVLLDFRDLINAAHEAELISIERRDLIIKNHEKH